MGEYLPTLIKCTKCLPTKLPLDIDNIVVIMDNISPMTKSLLRRIVAAYPVADGIVRVVVIRTTSATYLT